MSEPKMIKIAGQDARHLHGILKTAEHCIDRLTAERDALLEELQKHATDRQIDEIKREMEAKGINPWGTKEAMDVELRKQASSPTKLREFKAGVKLAADLGRARLGDLADGPSDHPAGSSVASRAELDSFVMNAGG